MPNVYSRTLRRAAHILGGADKLATELQVSPTNLALWMQGTGVPPSDVFLQAVDLVTAHGVSELLPSKKD
jgi:DNA-binding transcriptional regulator YdaS (Cro superfamily)